MPNRVFCFNAGPGALPLEVLQHVQAELLDYQGTGMSILELSHRSAEFEAVNHRAAALVRELAGLGEEYRVLFVGGGASLQFSMVPMNLLPAGGAAAYVDTGEWSSKAIREARRVGVVDVVYSSQTSDYDHVPAPGEVRVPGDAAYLHLTSNNTIFGTEYAAFPEAGSVPLVCDMSSDLFARTRDFRKFGLIYAGAQKNLGPAGVTLVIVRQDLLARGPDTLPTMLNYRTHADAGSLYNTPPAFSIYMVQLVLEWIKTQGGLTHMEAVNRRKQELIYSVLDAHPDYFRGTARRDSRSWMNLTWRLPDETLEKKFVEEATRAGLVGLKGHRAVGGLRASLYNAVPLAGAERLAEFMTDFMTANPR